MVKKIHKTDMHAIPMFYVCINNVIQHASKLNNSNQI